MSVCREVRGGVRGGHMGEEVREKVKVFLQSEATNGWNGVG